MKPFVVYDPATGAIRFSGVVPDADIDKQGDNSLEGIGKVGQHYVDVATKTIVPIPPQPGSSYIWDTAAKTWTFQLSNGVALKNAEIGRAAQAALTEVVAAYPDLEVATWPQQYAEAQAYTANNSVATPMLSAISNAAGLTIADLAANVIAKASAYQSASGAVVGKRIALQTKIAAATTQADLDAISW